MTLGVDDLRSLKSAEAIADNVWKRVARWGPFARDALGKPLVEAADAIGASLAEAFGQATPAGRLSHYYAARGSLYETKYWLNRAQERELLDAETVAAYAQELTELARLLNDLAAATRAQRAEGDAGHSVREADAPYQPDAAVLFSTADLDWLRG
jgi:four helix bundle protein